MRWGILGASSFALKAMGPAIHAARGAELVAVASRDAGKVGPFQAFAPGARAMGYEEMLAADDIDAIYIPLPNHLHVPWALKVLDAGKHILVEKPVGLSVTEVDHLIVARDTAGRMAAEAFMIAHHPQWARVRELLADGAVGELRHVQAYFAYDNSADPANVRNQQGMGGGALRDIGVYTIGSAQSQWARVRELLADGAVGELRHVQAYFAYDNSADPANVRNQQGMGGGALRDIGVYTIGSAQLALGAPLTDIRARMQRDGDFDLTTYVQGRIAGASYECYVSMRMMRAQGVRFHGTTGEIVLPAPFNPPDIGEARVKLRRPSGIQVDHFPMARQYVTQVEAFGAAAQGAGYAWPLERARDTQAALDEVLRVAEEM
ncbi:MAG: Gfo/Idh/MocA family oxidoreductase [Shimia sp.]